MNKILTKKERQSIAYKKWYLKNKEKHNKRTREWYWEVGKKRYEPRLQLFSKIKKSFQKRILAIARPIWREQMRKRNVRNNYLKYKHKNYEMHKIYSLRNPLKKKARTAVMNAKADGRLKQQPCSCQRFGWRCDGRVETHHWDYSKPLDVVWVCKRHHSILDKVAKLKTLC